MKEDSSIVKLSENIHPSAGGVILSPLAKNENKREKETPSFKTVWQFWKPCFQTERSP